MTEKDSEDERDTELSSIQAIFPELRITSDETRKADLDLEVAPSKPLSITFDPPGPPPELTPPTPPNRLRTQNPRRHGAPAAVAADSHELEFLPSLHLEITLPTTYPASHPPSVRLSTSPSWIPQDVVDRMSVELSSLWEEYGHNQVVFAYIDFLQQEAERAFGILDDSRLPHELKDPLLSFNHRTKREKFEQETFECGVCLEPKKGSSCHRLEKCSHVFCVKCLQDFYNSAITEGDVSSVKCLDPDCGKKDGDGTGPKKKKSLHPRELLAIPIERSQVQHYVDIKLKKKLESDKTAIFCPRTFCQAPARSAKYAKYNSADLESYPESDDEDEDRPAVVNAGRRRRAAGPITKPEGRLAICSKCTFAFCRVCEKSWHGDFFLCRRKNELPKQLTREELASYDFIRLNTSPCPTCNAPSQKTHGCNHMICYQCKTHFCYLCSAWLSRFNPYSHFNQIGESCYMRLWELEEGDEGGQGNGRAAARGPFGGPRAAEQAVAFAHMFEEDAQVRQVHEDQAHDNGPRQPPAPAVPVPNAAPVAAPAPPPARNGAPNPNQNGNGNRNRNARQPDPALQRFLQMAANDEEDGWDSDDMEFEGFQAIFD